MKKVSPTKSHLLQNTKKLKEFTRTFNTSLCGASMWPMLRDGDSIQYKKINPEHLRIGDIFLFRSKGKRGESLVKIHRFIGRVGEYFVESGDNAMQASFVTSEQVVGVAISFERNNKKKLITSKELTKQQKIYFRLAQGFLLIHSSKNIFFANRKSKILWTASDLYRKSLKKLFGLDVPLIFPHSK